MTLCELCSCGRTCRKRIRISPRRVRAIRAYCHIPLSYPAYSDLLYDPILRFPKVRRIQTVCRGLDMSELDCVRATVGFEGGLVCSTVLSEV